MSVYKAIIDEIDIDDLDEKGQLKGSVGRPTPRYKPLIGNNSSNHHKKLNNHNDEDFHGAVKAAFGVADRTGKKLLNSKRYNKSLADVYSSSKAGSSSGILDDEDDDEEMLKGLGVIGIDGDVEGCESSPLLSFVDEDYAVGLGVDGDIGNEVGVDFDDLEDMLQLSQSFSNDDFPDDTVDESDINFHEVS